MQNIQLLDEKKMRKYFLREINRIVPLPLNYPVDVNVYEAEAFL